MEDYPAIELVECKRIKKKEKMSITNFDQLLEAGVHFGHLKRKWNPAMAPYICMERNGGMLTNFPTIRKAVKKMTTIDKMTKDGTFDNLSKREKLQVTRQRAKLEKTLGSIADLTRLPSALFVVDVMKEHIAVREANRLGIPVFAMVDTNSDPSNVDFVIPANDDATNSIEVILGAVCGAIAEGLEERKAEKVDVEAVEGEAPKKERKTRAVKKERTKKEDDEALNANVAEKFMKDVEE